MAFENSIWWLNMPEQAVSKICTSLRSPRYTGVSEEVFRTVDSFKVLFRFIVELLGFLLELIEATLGVGIDGILGVFTDVELDLELLWGTHDALLKTLETHDGVWGERIVQGRLVKEEKKKEEEEERESRWKSQGRGGSSYVMGELLLRPFRSQRAVSRS